MKKMALIFNPHTGGNRLKNKLMEILCLFSAGGYEVTTLPTQGPGDATRFAAAHGGQCERLVCCGGDGTLNETVSGLMQLPPESRPTLGYLPCGTTNDFASSLLLPKSNIMAAAGRALNPRKVFPCDIGSFNERHFTYVAAFGAFTDVPYTTPQSIKNALGYFAYLLEAVQKLPAIRPTHIRFCSEEGVFEDDYLFGMVLNSASVAGFSFPGKHKIRLDDGLMEVLLVRHPQNLAELREVSAALLSKGAQSHLLTTLHIKSAAFEADRPVSWTLDGEFGGELAEADFKVHHHAVGICI